MASGIFCGETQETKWKREGEIFTHPEEGMASSPHNPHAAKDVTEDSFAAYMHDSLMVNSFINPIPFSDFSSDMIMSPGNAGFAYKASNAPPPLEAASGPAPLLHANASMYPSFASFAPSPNLLSDVTSEHAVITRSRGKPDGRKRAVTSMYSSVMYDYQAPSAGFGSMTSLYGSVGSQSTVGGSFGSITTCNVYGPTPGVKQLDMMHGDVAADEPTAQITDPMLRQERPESRNSCLSHDSVSISSLADTHTTFSGSKRPHISPAASAPSPAKRSRHTSVDASKGELQQLLPGWDANSDAERVLHEKSAALGVEPLEVLRYLILQYIDNVELHHIRPFAAVKNSKATRR